MSINNKNVYHTFTHLEWASSNTGSPTARDAVIDKWMKDATDIRRRKQVGLYLKMNPIDHICPISSIFLC